MSFLAVSVGIGVVTAGSKIVSGIHQNHLANQIHPEYTPYTANPYAAKQFGIANQLFNGRMAGASDQEKNIASSQANYLNNVNQNATDSGQALALGGLSEGITNNAYQQLGIQEEQNKYGLLGNLNTAYQAMINEGNKVYTSQAQKYQSDVDAKTALRNAGAQNTFSGFSDLGSGAFMANQFLSDNPYKYPTLTTH